MTINQLGSIVHRNAVSKGFYDDISDLLDHPTLTNKQKEFILYLWRSNRLMLIVSELSEGLEGLRNGNLSTEPNSGGLGEELADAQIRLADFGIDLGISLEDTVQRKHDYNVTRPFKHGGKQG